MDNEGGTAEIELKDGTKYFWFEGVRGANVEFFVDGKLVMAISDAEDVKINVPFDATAEDEHELRIVVEAKSDNDSGIVNKVSLRTSPGQDIKLTV